MRTVRGITVAALSAVTVLGFTGLLGIELQASPAGATTPQWKTTASFSPLANVSAVSCAPSSSAATSTCVAVGDDGGGHFASIIVTDNGGSTWTDAPPPAGVTTLSTVSCPTASVCYAGGGDGIIKSSNGGTSWVRQDQGFPAESISCFTIDECTAVGGAGIQARPTGPHGALKFLRPTQAISQMCLVPTPSPALQLELISGKPSVVGATETTTWSVIDQPLLTSLANISCATGSTCVAVGIAAAGGGTSISTANGGESWTAANSTGKQLNGVDCETSSDCIAVGTNLNSVSICHQHNQQRVDAGHRKIHLRMRSISRASPARRPETALQSATVVTTDLGRSS